MNFFERMDSLFRERKSPIPLSLKEAEEILDVCVYGAYLCTDIALIISEGRTLERPSWMKIGDWKKRRVVFNNIVKNNPGIMERLHDVYQQRSPLRSAESGAISRLLANEDPYPEDADNIIASHKSWKNDVVNVLVGALQNAGYVEK